MAKSIRSKHRRRMRSIKRKNFKQKELVKLNATVVRGIIHKDAQMAEICTMKSASELKADEAADVDTPKMEIDGTSQIYDKKTRKDANGQYPVWMNQRAIRKQKKKNNKAKVNKGKKKSDW